MSAKFMVLADHHILAIPVTPEMLKKAQEKAKKLGCLNKHSMMKGDRSVAGVLGELAALELLPQAKYVDNHDYDLSIGTITIDVKTKERGGKPRLDYDCSIYGYNPDQKCHLYLFATVNKEHTMVWFNGFLAKHIFYQKAKYFAAGSERPLGGGRTLTYKEDNYVVEVNQLNRTEILKTIRPKETV